LLDLGWCQDITDAGVRDFGRLKHLQLLGLRQNRISCLPDDIGSLQQLRTLDLRHNRLARLLPFSRSYAAGARAYSNTALIGRGSFEKAS
jgi:hypothetical protein